MIVKVQTFKDNFVDSYEEQIYSNVEKIFKERDINQDIFIKLITKGQEIEEIIPITHIDENGNHPALVGAVWLMNNDGKTIERIF